MQLSTFVLLIKQHFFWPFFQTDVYLDPSPRPAVPAPSEPACAKPCARQAFCCSQVLQVDEQYFHCPLNCWPVQQEPVLRWLFLNYFLYFCLEPQVISMKWGWCFWGGGRGGCWAFYFKLSERNHKGWEKSEGWAGRRGQQSPSCSKGEWDHLCLPLPKAHSTQTALLSQGTRNKSSLGHDGSPGAQGHAAVVRHIIVKKEQT